MAKGMFMLDLCSGLGGASRAMKERGWEVVTVDIEPNFHPDVVTDIREWAWDGPRPDLIWASPPCTEFAKFVMPCWFDISKLPPPDTSLVLACRRIIEETQPRFWIIENVRGAVPFFEPMLGRPAFVANPYFLWGHFPLLGDVGRAKFTMKTKKLSSTAKAKRAMIPYSLSLAVARAVESQQELPLPNQSMENDARAGGGEGGQDTLA